MIALLDDTHFSAIGIYHPHMANGDLNSKFNNKTIIFYMIRKFYIPTTYRYIQIYIDKIISPLYALISWYVHLESHV